MAVWDCVGSCRASTGGRMVPGLPVGCCGGPGCLVVAVWDCGGPDVAMGDCGRPGVAVGGPPGFR